MVPRVPLFRLRRKGAPRERFGSVEGRPSVASGDRRRPFGGPCAVACVSDWSSLGYSLVAADIKPGDFWDSTPSFERWRLQPGVVSSGGPFDVALSAESAVCPATSGEFGLPELCARRGGPSPPG